MHNITTMTVFNILFLFFIVFLKSQNCFTAPVKEKECPTKFHFEKNTIQELLRITSFQSEEDDAQFKESVGCIWKNEGLVDEYGILHVVNFRRAMVAEFRKEFPGDVAEDKAQDVLSYCRNVGGRNAGDTAANMINCLAKWKVEHFIDNERAQSY